MPRVDDLGALRRRMCAHRRVLRELVAKPIANGGLSADFSRRHRNKGLHDVFNLRKALVQVHLGELTWWNISQVIAILVVKQTFAESLRGGTRHLDEVTDTLCNVQIVIRATLRATRRAIQLFFKEQVCLGLNIIHEVIHRRVVQMVDQLTSYLAVFVVGFSLCDGVKARRQTRFSKFKAYVTVIPIENGVHHIESSQKSFVVSTVFIQGSARLFVAATKEEHHVVSALRTNIRHLQMLFERKLEK
mmetsp:Transcript_4177/g.15300  ORF Transcript_4177/g.15300 Transcript_4177/m.15300 type:complete len:246 (+) Transcript_4177:2650-3387(+)